MYTYVLHNEGSTPQGIYVVHYYFILPIDLEKETMIVGVWLILIDLIIQKFFSFRTPNSELTANFIIYKVF